jgi:hypothetical protein
MPEDRKARKVRGWIPVVASDAVECVGCKAARPTAIGATMMTTTWAATSGTSWYVHGPGVATCSDACRMDAELPAVPGDMFYR